MCAQRNNGVDFGTPPPGGGASPTTVLTIPSWLKTTFAMLGVAVLAFGLLVVRGGVFGQTADAAPAAPAATVPVCSTVTQGVFTFVDRSGYAADELSVSSSADPSLTYQYSLDRGAPVNILPGGVANVGANSTRDFSLVAYVKNGDTVVSTYNFTVTNKDCGSTTTTSAPPTSSTSTTTTKPPVTTTTKPPVTTTTSVPSTTTSTTSVPPTTSTSTTSTKPPVTTTGTQKAHKSYVCKYVGTPGVDERLQTGQNPIWVDNHSLLGYDGTVTVGQEFKDKQGRSIVIVANTPKLSPEPGVDQCPSPEGPPVTTPPVTTTTTTATTPPVTTTSTTSVPPTTSTSTTATVPPTTTSTVPPTTKPPVSHPTSSQPSSTKTTKAAPVVVPPTSNNGGGESTPAPNAGAGTGYEQTVSETAPNWVGIAFGLIALVGLMIVLAQRQKRGTNA